MKHNKNSKKEKDFLCIKQNNNTKNHNGIISFWKFMFCMLIVIYHTNILTKNLNEVLFLKGNIGVEFFFLVSGYLLCKKVLNLEEMTDTKNLGKETFDYLLKKVKTFFPYVFFAGIMALILINFFNGFNLYNNVTSIWDLLLLKMTGLKGLDLNGPVWYISSMLLCMLILYPLIRKHKYNYIYILAPLIVFFGLGYINQNYGSMRGPLFWVGLTYKGNLRAFVELTLGTLLYVICEKLKKLNFTLFGKLVLTIIEITCFVIPFLMSQFMLSASKYDMITIMIISIGIVLAFSEQTLELNLLNNKISYWLEKLSFTLFIFHFPLLIIMQNVSFFVNMSYLLKVLSFSIISIIISIIALYLIPYLKKHNYFLNGIKKLMIK